MSERWEQPLEDLSTFVGREREVARLRHLFQRTLKGNGGLALVSGEAGNGKAALVWEVASEAHGQSARGGPRRRLRGYNAA